MWAQEWGNVYPLVEPYKGQPSLDVTAALKAQKATTRRSWCKLGESFFTSLGMDALPATFWERSQFTRSPADREVVCHASAWDVTYSNDLRIKMCIKVDEEDLITVHHELGHDYYFMQYYQKPVLFQQGANDGFHEAIGDALTSRITPAYLKKLGLIKEVPKDEKGLINLQMKDALEKVAFLPFGRLVDQWRWDVFSGKTPPSEYNKHWWELRKKYQGVAPPTAAHRSRLRPRREVPRARERAVHALLSRAHPSVPVSPRAVQGGGLHTGPLHTCSIYGNKVAGAKLRAMLAMGASKPWPDALSRSPAVSRSSMRRPLTDYFAPSADGGSKEQNKGQKCGW